MALLQNELDRLDRLDAESASIEEIRNVDSVPGIKLEGKDEENNELDSPTFKGGNGRGKEPSLLHKGESRPQMRDESKKVEEVTISGTLETMSTKAPCRQCSDGF